MKTQLRSKCQDRSSRISTKHQDPRSREAPSSKLQKESQREQSEFGSWSIPGSPERGIALVITLILLAIITFLAITLLVVTRSEKGTVGVKADQTTAALA